MIFLYTILYGSDSSNGTHILPSGHRKSSIIVLACATPAAREEECPVIDRLRPEAGDVQSKSTEPRPRMNPRKLRSSSSCALSRSTISYDLCWANGHGVITYSVTVCEPPDMSALRCTVANSMCLSRRIGTQEATRSKAWTECPEDGH